MTEKDNIKRPDWPSQTTSFLLGAASGMATNLLSGATAYRAIGASVALAALLTASARLRNMPARAPIVRYGIVSMLTLSLGAIALAAFGPTNLTPYWIFSAVGLTSAAVLVHAEIETRLRIVAAMATIAVGTVIVAYGIVTVDSGITYMAQEELVLGIMVVGIGLASAGIGIAFLTGRDLIVAIAVIGLGLIGVGAGVVALASYDIPVFGTVGVAFGVIGVGAGIALVTRRDFIVGTVGVGLGVPVVGLGIVFLPHSFLLTAIVSVGLGVPVVAVGIALLTRHNLTIGVTVIGAGIAAVCAGTAFVNYGIAVLDGNFDFVALGIAIVGGGIAVVGTGITFLSKSDGGSRAKHWLTSLTKEPDGSVGH